MELRDNPDGRPIARIGELHRRRPKLLRIEAWYGEQAQYKNRKQGQETARQFFHDVSMLILWADS